MRSQRPVALVDVRCMFVSVERVIDPLLRGKPVIVLSNNDGCAVSLSNEAKALGVGMGDPWFEIREKPDLSQVIARSSNYAEYGAWSARFHQAVATLAAQCEIYSVDEAFITLLGRDPAAATAGIQDRVRLWTGLPTAAGVGATKTLAKVAQRHAKGIGTGLVDLTTWPSDQVTELLAATPTSDVWGVGSRLRAGLAGIGVHTALDLARADAGYLRRRWSVTLERTARELAGTPCMPVGFTPRHRQQLMYSRMLGATVTSPSEMRGVLAQYAANAAWRLRTHDLEASLMQVWISSSPYRDRIEHHVHSAALDPPTDDPLSLIAASRGVLTRMVEGHPYNRAGILLTGLRPAGSRPTFWTSDDDPRRRLADVVDDIHGRFGRQSVGYGPTGLRGHRRWDMRRQMLSPAATTQWDQLLEVH